MGFMGFRIGFRVQGFRDWGFGVRTGFRDWVHRIWVFFEVPYCYTSAAGNMFCSRACSAAARVHPTTGAPSEILRLASLKQPADRQMVKKFVDAHLEAWQKKPKLVRGLLQELKALRRADLVGAMFGELDRHGRIRLGLPEYTLAISTCAKAEQWQLALQMLGPRVGPSSFSF